MTDDLTFSERQAVILMTEHFTHLIRVGLRTNKHDFINKETLQNVLDKLGGNIELNKKRYEEQLKQNDKLS